MFRGRGGRLEVLKFFQGLRLLQPGVQGFGPVEGEHPAGTGARVAQVAEKGLVAGGLVIEAEDGVPLG